MERIHAMNTMIPAGAGEKMQYIVHPFNDNTIRFVLRYPRLLNADVLQQATFALVSSIDVLHASFIAGKAKARWQVNTVRPEDCFKHIITDADPVPRALTEALHPISAGDPVQMRCILVQGTQESAVVLLISHLCADGSDGKYLLRKLCEAYNMLYQSGTCASLEVKNGSRAVEQVYTQLNKQDRLKLLKDPRTGVKSVFPFPTADAGHPSVLWRQIPAEQMSAVHQKVEQIGATVNDLLLTACYYAYAETVGIAQGEPISIMSMMDLRRHCDGGDSEGLCNLTGPLVTALPDGLKTTFGETLAEISQQTRRSKEDPFAGLYGMPLLHGAANKLPMALLLSAASHVYGSMSLGMTNVGNIDCHTLQLENTPPIMGWFGGPVKHKPGVQLSVASFSGTCSLCFWNDTTDDDKIMLDQFLDRVIKYIIGDHQE